MHPTFLERDSQVDAVLGYAAEAAAGTGRLVLVQGEAGGGKSTLLEQVEERLPDATWHWGACDGLFTPLPLAPLRDIADEHRRPAARASRADASRETLFAALLEAVRADPSLTVLVVEDVQWADEATLDLLRFLGGASRRSGRCCSSRFREEDSASSSTLRKALGELARQRATRRVSLAPLSRTRGRAARRRHRPRPGRGAPPHRRQPLLRRRGGRAARTAGSRHPPATRCWPAPSTSTRRPGTCSTSRPWPATASTPRCSAAVADAPEAAYETLVDAGLLVTDGRSLRFRHEIARLSVADAVPEPRRTTLHGRLLAALLERGEGDDSRLAFHAAGAGDTAAVVQHSMGGRPTRRRARLPPGGRRAPPPDPRGRRPTSASTHAPGPRCSTTCPPSSGWSTSGRRRSTGGPRRSGSGRAWATPLHEGNSLRMHARALSRLARGAEARQALDRGARRARAARADARTRAQPWSTSPRSSGTRERPSRRSRRATAPRRSPSSSTFPTCSATC